MVVTSKKDKIKEPWHHPTEEQHFPVTGFQTLRGSMGKSVDIVPALGGPHVML